MLWLFSEWTDNFPYTHGVSMLWLFSEWTDNFPYDFRDEHMSKCLKDMTQLLVNIYPELRRDVGILMHNLFSKVSFVKRISWSNMHIVMLVLFRNSTASGVDALGRGETGPVYVHCVVIYLYLSLMWGECPVQGPKAVEETRSIFWPDGVKDDLN